MEQFLARGTVISVPEEEPACHDNSGMEASRTHLGVSETNSRDSSSVHPGQKGKQGVLQKL